MAAHLLNFSAHLSDEVIKVGWLSRALACRRGENKDGDGGEREDEVKTGKKGGPLASRTSAPIKGLGAVCHGFSSFLSPLRCRRSPWPLSLFGVFFIIVFFLFFLSTLTLSARCSEAPNQQRSDWEVDVGRPLLPPRGLSGNVTLGFSHCQEAGWMKTLGYWFKGPRKKYLSFNCFFNLI